MIPSIVNNVFAPGDEKYFRGTRHTHWNLVRYDSVHPGLVELTQGQPSLKESIVL